MQCGNLRNVNPSPNLGITMMLVVDAGGGATIGLGPTETGVGTCADSRRQAQGWERTGGDASARVHSCVAAHVRNECRYVRAGADGSSQNRRSGRERTYLCASAHVCAHVRDECRHAQTGAGRSRQEQTGAGRTDTRQSHFTHFMGEACEDLFRLRLG